MSNPTPDIITLKGKEIDIIKHPIKPQIGITLP